MMEAGLGSYRGRDYQERVVLWLSRKHAGHIILVPPPAARVQGY